MPDFLEKHASQGRLVRSNQNFAASATTTPPQPLACMSPQEYVPNDDVAGVVEEAGKCRFDGKRRIG
jgi:hypothetical protein